MKTQSKIGKSILVIALTLATFLGGFVATGGSNAATPTVQVKQNHAQLLQQAKKLAEKGKVKTSGEFGIYSSSKAIEKKWGKADKSSKNGELRYSKHSTVFK